MAVENEGAHGQLIVGAIADELYEVIEIEVDKLEPPPRFNVMIYSPFIKKAGRRAGHFMIILDLDRAFNDDEARKIE